VVSEPDRRVRAADGQRDSRRRRPDRAGNRDPADRARHLAAHRPERQGWRARRAGDRLPAHRHARAYGNEAEVGAGIAASGVDRGGILLTTKIGPSDAEPARLKRAAEASLRALDTEYVDLLLLHWPSRSVPLERTLQAFRELQEQQKIRHAGVSNFPAGMLERALDIVPLLADQVEYHPFLAQDALLQLVADRDLTLTAYSPLARGKVARERTLAEIGEEHAKSAGQVALRWLIEQPNVTAVPKASSHERRAENFDVFDFELTDADRDRIAALRKD
jgi:2,5-diketo-D-gluconate reductase B